jgi:hypothetical protein
MNPDRPSPATTLPAASRFTDVGALEHGLADFMRRIQDPARPGRFRPGPDGATQTGLDAALPFSCYALKIYLTLGWWDRLDAHDQQTWIRFIQSFQRNDPTPPNALPPNPFLDPAVSEPSLMPPRPGLWRRALGLGPRLDPVWLGLMSETKQAVATLAEVGARPLRPFGALPLTPRGVTHHLRQLDWKNPWGGGAQAAVLSVLLATQAPDLVGPDAAAKLLDAVARFIDGVVDSASGAYFRGKRPKHGRLINGAMKVLTALDWLNEPVHYPERLIDTCLQELPKPEGCHLVDAVYVLDRCLLQTDHRRDECRAFALDVMKGVERHLRDDGGFSYYLASSQTVYKKRTISDGRLEGDIHATCLLTWAIAMIDRICGSQSRGWKIIRP